MPSKCWTSMTHFCHRFPKVLFSSLPTKGKASGAKVNSRKYQNLVTVQYKNERGLGQRRRCVVLSFVSVRFFEEDFYVRNVSQKSSPECRSFHPRSVPVGLQHYMYVPPDPQRAGNDLTEMEVPITVSVESMGT